DLARAAVLLAGEEQELTVVGGHFGEEDAHRGVDHAAHLELVTAYLADRRTEGLADFRHQRQTEFIHIGEMAVETGRHDAGAAGHFTQAQAAETAAALHQREGGIHQGLAGLLLLFGAWRHARSGSLSDAAL